MNLGKAKLMVKVIGCYRCGTQWASGWASVGEIKVMVNRKVIYRQVYVCATCAGISTCGK